MGKPSSNGQMSQQTRIESIILATVSTPPQVAGKRTRISIGTTETRTLMSSRGWLRFRRSSISKLKLLPQHWGSLHLHHPQQCQPTRLDYLRQTLRRRSQKKIRLQGRRGGNGKPSERRRSKGRRKRNERERKDDEKGIRVEKEKCETMTTAGGEGAPGLLLHDWPPDKAIPRQIAILATPADMIHRGDLEQAVADHGTPFSLACIRNLHC